MGGEGATKLRHLLETVKKQKYVQYEVIISDHSVDREIESLCEEFDVLYIRNEKNRGSSSSNLNNAISFAKGDFIKPMFQDDFFFSPYSLYYFMKKVEEGFSWVASSCTHFDGTVFQNPHTPFFNSEIHLGRNTISSPSVIMYRKDPEVIFDENLIWLMDVDFYKRFQMKHGDPGICEDILIVNGIGNHQVSNTLATEEIRKREFKYIKEKYKI